MDTKELLAVIADNTFDPINPQHLTAITSLQKMLVELSNYTLLARIPDYKAN